MGMGHTVRKSADALGILLFMIFMSLIVFSSLIFYAEKGTCVQRGSEEPCDFCTGQLNATCVLRRSTPFGFLEGEDESPFRSVPSCFWWCMATITTVGYGDV